ncbi:MAG: hypothetical protein HY769_04820 [Candidatus Stahlbacteria bacterium]|nr:hypothetical protein [Candidatus Stahlbacteria bacterium]
MNKLLIHADIREKASGIIDMLKNNGVEVRLSTMEIGDYQVSERVCIERKTATDFVGGIKTKRLFRQIVELRKAFERPLLLIEGYKLYQIKGVYPAGIRGALSMIAVTHRIPILFTQDTADTAQFIITIAKQEQIVHPEDSFYPKPKVKTPEKELERILEAFPGIGPKVTRELLTRYKSLSEIINAPIEDLILVPLIGKKKASKIKEVLTREYKL